ncbi:MAG: hypothetical protein EZS28_052824, partial [Streblomastix strix]
TIIQRRLNISLLPFCQILPKLRTDQFLSQLVVPRIKILSSMTNSIEPCQAYLAIYKDSQPNSETQPPIPPSVAFSTFKAACVREMMNPNNAQFKARIQDELNQCMAHVQNIVTLVTF